MNLAVLGAAFGDEGKGHIIHHYSKDYDWVIRFNGGANAGHTIYRDGKKYVHNLLPSVDFRHPNIKAYLGSGMVIDLEKLRNEVYAADDAFPGIAKNIYVDKSAFLVESRHKEEDKEKNGHIGSTNRGIGPAYKDKMDRKGVRIGDLFNYRFNDPYYDDFIYQLVGRGVNFVDLLEVKNEMVGKNLLYEGAQGILLDINHGIYPYVSCSEATVAGIYSSGFHWAPPDRVIGVAKAYATKVGTGPFPTELEGAEAEALRERGQEYGATTGRPRRIGWLDLPALKYACQVGGITELVITKFDILNGMEEVPVCIAYDKPVTSPQDFFKAQAQYVKIPGWKNAKELNQLSPFITQITNSTGKRVTQISCGTKPEDILDW